MFWPRITLYFRCHLDQTSEEKNVVPESTAMSVEPLPLKFEKNLMESHELDTTGIASSSSKSAER